MAKLTVHRKAYTRKAYVRKGYVRKGGIRVKPAKVGRSRVPATTYKIKDVGAKGRGKKIVRITHKGRMTQTAMRMGLLKQGQRIKDLDKFQLRKLARGLVKRYGATATKGMFQAQALFRKRTDGNFAKRMKAVRAYVGDKYSKQLTPRAAIRKWKSMSHAARARAMPERKGKKGYKLVAGRWRKA